MSKQPREFQGIWIPAEIWLSPNLTLQEKVFLVEIQSLDGDDGCYATNEHFAKFFGLSRVRVSEVIRSLIAKKLITSTIDKSAGNRRTLRTLLKKPLIPSQRKVYEGHKGKHDRVLKESLTPIIGMNNTVNNTTNTPPNPQGEERVPSAAKPKKPRRDITAEYEEQIQQIVARLNERCGTDYHTTTTGTRQKIAKRIGEGWTVENFVAVIDHKAKEWRGTSMQKYLRPETLFSEKFEGYVNEARASHTGLPAPKGQSSHTAPPVSNHRSDKPTYGEKPLNLDFLDQQARNRN